jgi:hypothetical protein
MVEKTNVNCYWEFFPRFSHSSTFSFFCTPWKKKDKNNKKKVKTKNYLRIKRTAVLFFLLLHVKLSLLASQFVVCHQKCFYVRSIII